MILVEGAGRHDGEVLAAELEAAGHMASLVSKQRAMDAHSQLIFSLLFSLGLSAYEMELLKFSIIFNLI